MEVARGQGRLSAEAADLPQGMDSGVGAPGAVEHDVFLGQLAQHADNFALNGRLAGLDLPAVKISAVVGDGELEIAHAEGNCLRSDYIAERTKRLPGLMAALPSRHCGQSSGS